MISDLKNDPHARLGVGVGEDESNSQGKQTRHPNTAQLQKSRTSKPSLPMPYKSSLRPGHEHRSQSLEKKSSMQKSIPVKE